jgi:hypothetical protein
MPYRIFLENRNLAAGAINGRLACEASDAGLVSPELAAGIRRVKGAKKLGVRLGNRLTAEEARRFRSLPASSMGWQEIPDEAGKMAAIAAPGIELS